MRETLAKFEALILNLVLTDISIPILRLTQKHFSVASVHRGQHMGGSILVFEKQFLFVHF